MVFAAIVEYDNLISVFDATCFGVCGVNENNRRLIADLVHPFKIVEGGVHTAIGFALYAKERVLLGEFVPVARVFFGASVGCNGIESILLLGRNPEFSFLGLGLEFAVLERDVIVVDHAYGMLFFKLVERNASGFENV